MKSPTRHSSAARCIAVLCLLALAPVGCIEYQIGSTLPPDFKSIHIRTFGNVTGQPQIEFATTQATIQEFQREGTLRVTTQDRADAVLEAKIVGYALQPLRYRKDQTTTANEYRLILDADVTLTARDGKAMMTAKRVQGTKTFTVAGDLKSAEVGAQPLAARDLAYHILESVIEYW
jgi:hypothetical protein